MLGIELGTWNEFVAGNFTFENKDMQILHNQHAKHHEFQGVNLNFLKKFCVRNTCSILYVCLTLYVH